jgi:hypothetical protein
MRDFNFDHSAALQKEFKLGFIAGVAMTIGVTVVAVMVYALFNPSILQ